MDKNKYFIAIVPPEPLQNNLMELKRELSVRYATKGALRSPAHITLHMPFELEGQKELRFLNAIQQLSFSLRPFEISLSGFDVFEPRVLFVDVLTSEQLLLLREMLVEWVKTQFSIFNQSDDKRGFHPHITIAFRDFKKPMFYQAWNEFRERKFSASFLCTEIHLLKLENERWNSIATIPLRSE
jgi:2'-5' RNA ligase